MPEGRALRVGLTGGIACGKSHVLARFSAAGFETIDLDHVAHEVMAPGGPAYQDVVLAFGPGILAPDGTIDRVALGEKVFSDDGLRARLNSLVHPRVRAEEARRVAAAAGGIVVTDAALLVESGVHLRFDRLVVVSCSVEEQVSRLRARNGLDEASARARIDAQMPTEQKRRFAHFEIQTSGSFDETDRAVEILVAELRDLAASPPAPARVPLSRSLACLLHGPSLGPGGLEPQRLLKEIAEAGGLEMERIARLLTPPRAGPWYRTPPGAADAPGPEAGVGPVVLWALASRGADAPFVLAAAASLARLTHTQPASIAGACLFALALAEAAVSGRNAGLDRLEEWRGLAARWGGDSPSAMVVDAVTEGLRLAQTEAPNPWQDIPSGLLGSLIGMARGLPEGELVPETLARDVLALGGSELPAPSSSA